MDVVQVQEQSDASIIKAEVIEEKEEINTRLRNTHIPKKVRKGLQVDEIQAMRLKLYQEGK
jgi:hypothetical protein